MPSIEPGCQQSTVRVPDAEMFPSDFLGTDFACSNDDVYGIFSSKLGMALGMEEKEMATETSSFPLFEELEFNLENTSESELEGISEIKNEIKSEPESPPDARYTFMSPVNLTSTVHLEPSGDSNGQITSLVQDVSDSIENFRFNAPLLPALQCTLSSPQSSQASSFASNAMQQVNSIQKDVSVNQHNIKHATYSLAKADNAEHSFMWPADIGKDGKQHNVITFQNCAKVMRYTKPEQMLSSRTLSETEPISTQNSSSFMRELEGKQSETKSTMFPRNVKIINTMSNIRPVNIAESVVAPSILNNDSVLCNIVHDSIRNNIPFPLMQNKTSSSPLIMKSEANVNLPKEDEEYRLKAYKRQQRMIKNRESACLSRKKRKEYVSSLERQVSDLKEENKQLKLENDILKQKLRIEMKDSIICENDKSGNSSLGSLLKTTSRKRFAIFLFLAFVISIHVNCRSGSFSQDLQLKTNPDNLQIIMPDITHNVHTRRLLWTVDGNNSMNDQIDENFNKSIPIQPVCPMYINQSEFIRLDSELRRWIDGESDQDNRTTLKEMKLTNMSNVALSRSSLEEKPKRRLYLPRDRKLKTMQKMIDVHDVDDQYSNDNAVQVFSPILSKHASLFEALGRKDDTFYVVWFSGEHLLLPASRKNDTARPKMSLVLPAVSINGTFSTPPNHITMMQIDCEVTNTQLLHLQQSIIPVHLRNGKSTSQSDRSHSVEDIVDPSVANLTRNYKPYFMREANRKQRYRKDIA
ncbi:Cyclic AMP-dependent transcription factor ATF-6 alpha [Ooceraea biroi]|uniref:Cyclic AMP-dependent transcription factor ATF-6 alpha n=1 Tax=Ooceraea biroi TaxID=2015173 RepID=A0A026WY25_OOCBI|nr:Cyclic AMP-dependent transcription factor ATF-6 alpha [Ooceraea biroi]